MSGSMLSDAVCILAALVGLSVYAWVMRRLA